MRSALLWPLIGMAALWVLTYLSAARRSRVGLQLVFLVGTLVAWPALAIGLAAEMFDVIFPSEQDKPVGEGGALIVLYAGAVALATWLAGFWAARLCGWFVQKRQGGKSNSTSADHPNDAERGPSKQYGKPSNACL